MKKILLAFILVFSVMFISSNTVLAASSPKILLNNEEVRFANKPIVQNGRTMVPFRNLLESLNASIDYNSATRTITSSTANVTVKLVLGEKVAVKNGELIQLSVAPYVRDGVTYVPLRFLSQSFNYVVDYKDSTIFISTGNQSSSSAASNSASNNTTNQTKNLTTEEIGKQSNRIAYIETFDSNGKIKGTGSGVSVDAGILTNYHVLIGATKAIVYLDDIKYETNIILKHDTDRDLALIQINKDNQPVIKIGDSTNVVQGEAIVAIGSPLGFSNTLSTGIISNKLRQVDGQSYIQFTAPIDYGSSGGALLNMRGELIGLTSAKMDSSASINFAIPSSDIVDFLDQPNTQITMEDLLTTAVDDTAMSLLQVYLNEELYFIYNDYVSLNLDWVVIKPEEETNYVAVAVVSNYRQFYDLHQAMANGNFTMGDLYHFVFQDVEENMGIKDLSVLIGIDSHTTTAPDSSLIDYDYINYNGSSYHIDYVFGMAVREGNRFIYYINPMISQDEYYSYIY